MGKPRRIVKETFAGACVEPPLVDLVLLEKPAKASLIFVFRCVDVVNRVQSDQSSIGKGPPTNVSRFAMPCPRSRRLDAPIHQQGARIVEKRRQW